MTHCLRYESVEGGGCQQIITMPLFLNATLRTFNRGVVLINEVAKKREEGGAGQMLPANSQPGTSLSDSSPLNELDR